MKNSNDIINFFIEAKSYIKRDNISSEEKKLYFLKIDEIYNKALETITDKEELKRITSKYEELKREKKIKNYRILAPFLIYLSILVIFFFYINNMFFLGIGLAILIFTNITFLYFNLDFNNLFKSIKNFEIKYTTENIICFITFSLAITIIFLSLLFVFIDKIKEAKAHKDYYDKNVEKYSVYIDIDFKNNLIFNRCDINLKIYNIDKYFKHGEDKLFEIGLPKGIHKIKFKGKDYTIVKEIKVEDDMKVKYKIECISSGINVEEVSN